MITLLLVEDNPQLRPALTTGLEATGAVWVLYACDKGEQALEFCLAGELPQAILMDVQLAGELNGIQAAAEISASSSLTFSCIQRFTNVSTDTPFCQAISLT